MPYDNPEPSGPWLGIASLLVLVLMVLVLAMAHSSQLSAP